MVPTSPLIFLCIRLGAFLDAKLNQPKERATVSGVLHKYWYPHMADERFPSLSPACLVPSCRGILGCPSLMCLRVPSTPPILHSPWLLTCIFPRCLSLPITFLPPTY